MNDIKKILIASICVVLAVAIAAGVSIGVLAGTVNGLKDTVAELQQANEAQEALNASMKAELDAAKANGENIVTAEEFESKLAEALGTQTQTMQSMIATAVKNQIEELGVEGLTEAQVNEIIDAAVANCLTEDDIDAIIADANAGLTKDEVKKIVADYTAGTLTYGQIVNLIEDETYALRKFLEDQIDVVADAVEALGGDIKDLEGSLDDVKVTVKVANDDEFKAAIENATDRVVIEFATAITANVEVPGGVDVTIIGTTEDATINGQIATTSSTEGVLTIKNCTINVSDAIVDSTGISQTGKSAIAVWGNQTVVCENVTFNMSLKDSTAISGWWDTGKGTTIIVKDSTFNCNGQRPLRTCGNITVENCTFNDPYRYAIQLTGKAGTANLLDKATINFNNNTINNGENGKAFVYGIQLEGETYGCNDLVINGKGNIINAGAWDTDNESTMYYCECGKVDHSTITWNTEVKPVHAN